MDDDAPPGGDGVLDLSVKFKTDDVVADLALSGFSGSAHRPCGRDKVRLNSRLGHSNEAAGAAAQKPPGPLVPVVEAAGLGRWTERTGGIYGEVRCSCLDRQASCVRMMIESPVNGESQSRAGILAGTCALA